jgi:NTE family protein
VLLVADADATPWTRFCVRSADTLLLVAHASDPIDSGALVARGAQRGAAAGPRHRALALVQPPSTLLPRYTRRWIDAFEVDAHHHVKLDDAVSAARLARTLLGRSVSVGLSGGGSRGYAHAGVFRALAEARVPIDAIAGTSMGALVGALRATGLEGPAFVRTLRERFVEQNIFDMPIAYLSAFSSRRLDTVLAALYGDAQIEDTWIPFTCVSCELESATRVEHRRGPLWRAVRASCALPGVFPPAEIDGRSHVDGVFLENLPLGRAGAYTVAVNVIPKIDPLAVDQLANGPWTRPLARGSMRLLGGTPTFLNALLRSIFLPTIRAAEALRSEVDVFIEPDVLGFGFLETHSFDKIERAGYTAARDDLARWLSREADVPRTE